LEEAQKTSSLIEALASMMRYTLESFKRTVTLAQEMRNLDDYLYIQRLRYEDRIVFGVDYDESVGHASIPCMIIQPLVENAIIHGMQETLEGGRITVTIKKDVDRLAIFVKDNGCGIPYERQAEISSSFATDNDDDDDDVNDVSRGIGLVNVYKRIKLFCAGMSAFHISSIPGQGTEIRIMIPLGEEGGCHEDTVADC
jgi:sensor histidine kinase YesM